MYDEVDLRGVSFKYQLRNICKAVKIFVNCRGKIIKIWVNVKRDV